MRWNRWCYSSFSYLDFQWIHWIQWKVKSSKIIIDLKISSISIFDSKEFFVICQWKIYFYDKIKFKLCFTQFYLWRIQWIQQIQWKYINRKNFNGVFSKWSRTFIEFREFRESEKSLRHLLCCLWLCGWVVESLSLTQEILGSNPAILLFDFNLFCHWIQRIQWKHLEKTPLNCLLGCDVFHRNWFWWRQCWCFF